MLEKASNAKKILVLFMSENAKNYAVLFYRWLVWGGGGKGQYVVRSISNEFHCVDCHVVIEYCTWMCFLVGQLARESKC